MADSDLTTDPLLGNVPVHGGYKVLGGVVLYEKLGQGGMGAVYRGKHLRLEIDVAVKVMAAPAGVHASQSDNYLQRFLREAKTAASVKHQNLIRVYDVNSDQGVHFLIMDYVDGESAGDRLKRRGVSGEGRLSEQEALEVCLGAAEGLAEAHEEGIVHRDVKPDNILIDKKGRVVVADLGLAKAFGGDSDSALAMGLSVTQQAVGTPYYMAPEQTRSARDVGPQADVWSLGVTLYQLVAGALPWDRTDLVELISSIRLEPAPDVRKRCADLSDGICAIVEKAMQKDPAERYADCAEMAKALSAHLDAIKRSGESVLPDAEAGKTKIALVTLTAPPAKTLTLIGESLIIAADSARMTAHPPADTAATVGAEAVALGRRGLPAWAVPLAAAGVVLVGLVLLVALGAGGKKDQADPIEAEAQAFLWRVTAAADDGRLEEAARLIEEAGPRYDATAAGPEISRLAETIATRERQEEEGRERARLEAEKRLSDAVRRADSAGEAGDLDKALQFLRQALQLRDDPALRASAAGLERALAARRLIEEGIAHEDAGELAQAKDAYRKAIPDAIGADRNEAEKRLKAVTRRIHVEETVAGIQRKVAAGEWREAWDGIEAARAAGLTDARLDGLARQAEKALAPAKTLTGPLGIALVFVPGGTFRIGCESGEKEEKPVHEVTVDSYYIGRFEVTRGQFEAFRQGLRTVTGSTSDEGRLPAVSVTWHEAVEFCKHLSSIDKGGAVYRLPREAEWEFAARGSDGRAYPWGDGPPGPGSANLGGEEDGFAGPAPVGSFPAGATPEGVCDLVGNAAEWCADWYGPYSDGPKTNPAGPAAGEERVLRGGAFAFSPEVWSRATMRVASAPDRRCEFVGFRVVRELTAEERMFEGAAGNE